MGPINWYESWKLTVVSYHSYVLFKWYHEVLGTIKPIPWSLFCVLFHSSFFFSFFCRGGGGVGSNYGLGFCSFYPKKKAHSNYSLSLLFTWPEITHFILKFWAQILLKQEEIVFLTKIIFPFIFMWICTRFHKIFLEISSTLLMLCTTIYNEVNHKCIKIMGFLQMLPSIIKNIFSISTIVSKGTKYITC